MAQADNLADKGGHVSVNGNIHIPLLQGSDIHHTFPPLSHAKEAVRSQISVDHGAKDKGQACPQKLLHNIPPITVACLSGIVESLKYLMVGADGKDIQFFPYFLSLRGSCVADHFVLVCLRTAKICQQHIREINGDVIDGSPCRLNVKGFGGGDEFFFSQDGQRQFSFCRPLQG